MMYNSIKNDIKAKKDKWMQIFRFSITLVIISVIRSKYNELDKIKGDVSREIKMMEYTKDKIENWIS